MAHFDFEEALNILDAPENFAAGEIEFDSERRYYKRQLNFKGVLPLGRYIQYKGNQYPILIGYNYIVDVTPPELRIEGINEYGTKELVMYAYTYDQYFHETDSLFVFSAFDASLPELYANRPRNSFAFKLASATIVVNSQDSTKLTIKNLFSRTKMNSYVTNETIPNADNLLSPELIRTFFVEDQALQGLCIMLSYLGVRLLRDRTLVASYLINLNNDYYTQYEQVMNATHWRRVLNEDISNPLLRYADTAEAPGLFVFVNKKEFEERWAAFLAKTKPNQRYNVYHNMVTKFLNDENIIDVAENYIDKLISYISSRNNNEQDAMVIGIFYEKAQRKAIFAYFAKFGFTYDWKRSLLLTVRMNDFKREVEKYFA